MEGEHIRPTSVKLSATVNDNPIESIIPTSSSVRSVRFSNVPTPLASDLLDSVRLGEELRATGEPVLLKESQAVVAGQLGAARENVRVLLDTGATGCFINQGFVDSRQIKTQVHDTPRPLTLFDGTPSSAGAIREFVEEDLHVIGQDTQVKFDVTLLSGVDIVLGYSWLKSRRAIIDFGHLSIRVGDEPQGGAESRTSNENPSHAKVDSNLATCGDDSDDTMSMSTSTYTSSDGSDCGDVRMLRGTKYSRKLAHRREAWRQKRRSNEFSSANMIPLGEPSRWNQGNASRESSLEGHIESRLCAIVDHVQPGDEDDSLPSFDEFELTEEEKQEVLNLVPSQYHDYLDVFHPRRGTGSLAPHREYDLKIELKPDHKLKVAPLYELSPSQREALKETIDRERAAGRIRPSNAAYGSPCFFVGKSDGRYRLVVDFRHLNQATIPDAYPLPLINQIYNDLSNAKYYSTLDLVSAYQQCRVAEGYEHLTAFRTMFGMFESLVVRDGLRNAPAVFQHFLNELFADLIAEGLVIVYIDDIIVACSTLEELRRITMLVLERLRGANLFVKASKCEFEKQEVKFLGVLISGAGIKADPGYVQGITDFPAPRTLKESRRFVGMASYYRRFIPNFAKKMRPLNILTRKDVPFKWGEDQEAGFQAVKKAMSEAPVIAHFNPQAETIVQADASLYGWGFVISQIDPVSKLEHPVAIESGSFKNAEINYTVTEKEFLAIVNAFKRKRHLLLQVQSTVLTDHLNLTYWMDPRQLNQRQARWVDFLSGFGYKMVYRPGTKADFPDALSRNPDYSPNGDAEPNLVQALPNFDTSSPVTSSLGHLLHALSSNLEEEDEDEGDLMRMEEMLDGLEADGDLDQVRAVFAQDEAVLLSPECPLPLSSLDGFAKRLGFTDPVFKYNDQGLLFINKKMYIPDHGKLRVSLLKAYHDSPLAGHQGVSKTLELLQRKFCWLGLRRDVETYVRGCASCQRTKPSRQRPQGYLQSLEISDGPWTSISMDFVEELPNSNGFNSILVVVDRLTKYATFIPTTTRLSTAGLVDLVIDNIVSRHGLPRSIISDRGSKFTSMLWREMCSVLGIKVSLSTAFHPQTDGQTERVNQVMEQYLRLFTSYKQDNWSGLLQRAAFTYNNSLHSAINMSPFFANYGYHPRGLDELEMQEEGTAPVVEKVKSITEVHELCKRNIDLANATYAKYYNDKRREQDAFEVGDQVLVSLQNVQTRRPSKKMDIRFAGPYSILEKIGTRAFKIELPPTMKIHPVFHVSLLKPFHTPQIEGQAYDPPGAVEVDEAGQSFEVSSIIDSRINKRRLEYLVEWLGYEGTAESATWQPARDLDGCSELLETFHRDYPAKPDPSWLKTRR
jgi:transposase InsO family protein